MRRRLLFAGALACLALMLAAAPAAAKGGSGGSHDRRISLSGALVVASGEVVTGPVVSIDGPTTIAGRVQNDVYIGRGALRVSGQVTGDVLVVDGDATITGRVDGDITDLHGRVTVLPGATVHGDITSSKAPRAAPGTVRGHVKTLDVNSIFTGFLVAALLALWVAVTVSIGILGLLFIVLFPRGADAVVTAGRRVGVSIVTGVVVGILGPILGVAIVTTIIGIPLGIGFLAVMTVLAPLGYASSALILGRLMIRGPGGGARIGAFFVGFGILRLVALIPGIGFIFWYAACFYGLGAVTVAAWRAGHRRTVPAGATPPASTIAPAAAPTIQPTAEGPSRATPSDSPGAVAPRTRSRPAAAATKQAPSKQAAAKKASTKRAGKKAAAKKTTAKKPAPRKVAAKQTAAKKAAAKEPEPRNPAATKKGSRSTTRTNRAPTKSARSASTTKRSGAPVKKAARRPAAGTSSSQAAGTAKRGTTRTPAAGRARPRR